MDYTGWAWLVRIFSHVPTELITGGGGAALGRPMLFVMEGGYAVDDIGVNTVNVLTGFEQRRQHV